MKKLSLATRRLRYLVSAWILTVTALTPALLTGTAHAAGTQVTARSIQMSSSAVSATGVTYKVKFTQTSSTIKSMVVDFCANSPIDTDSCTGTVGTTVPNVTSATFTAVAGVTGTYTVGTLNSNRTVTLTKTAGDSGVTNVEFDVGGIVNRSSLGTFYARVYTFPNDTDAASYTPASPAATYNYGGIALSTAAQLTVTAKVQESLTFCVYETGANCAGASGTAVTLGDSNGVLSNAATTYIDTASFGLASNAQTGVTVRFKGATLASGGNSITATGTGSGSCTADVVTTTVEQFGLRVSSAGSGVTADAGYACSSGNHSFDSTNTATTYGDTLATTAGATDESQTALEFAAKSATATEAGIYTSTLTFIATGIY